MKILFVDLTCAFPYNKKSLVEDPVAGVEIAVIRVAEALNKKHTVYVAQHNRDTNELNKAAASYISVDDAKNLTGDNEPDVLIFLRKYRVFDKYASLYPHAKKIFWQLDLARYTMRKWRWAFKKHNCPIIAISQFHQNDIKDKLKGKWYHKIYDFFTQQTMPQVDYIYCPLDDTLMPNDTPVDKNKLVFFSSPNKGLDETIRRFLAAKKAIPELCLYITNPGYMKIEGYKHLDAELLRKEGIITLGTLNRHKDVMQHVREAFCVFCPQKYKAENFGYVYTEANAVGTPVISYDFGAAKEVLNNDDQIVDETKPDDIINKLLKWRKDGRPKVSAKEIYREHNVTKEWKQLIER
jgi:glycosyltransferase involved in cell wall biosynthesis